MLKCWWSLAAVVVDEELEGWVEVLEAVELVV